MIDLIKVFISLFKGVKEKKKLAVDHNTLKIRSVAELDDFDRANLKKEYDEFCTEVNNAAETEAKRQLTAIAEHNSKCPKCSKQEVVQRIETSSEKGYGKSSNIHTVTTTINHCTSCSHDWEHKSNRTYTQSKYDIAEAIITLLRYYHESKHEIVFNPNKLDNEYDTLEETRNAAIKKIQNSHYFITVMPHLKGKSVKLAKYLVENVYGEFEQHKWKIDEWHKYDKRPLLEWGLKD